MDFTTEAANLLEDLKTADVKEFLALVRAYLERAYKAGALREKQHK